MIRFAPAAAVLLVLLAPRASAQDRTAEVDKIFGWATADSPGCVIAASQDGKPIVNRAYGLADLERNVPMSTSTVFDAGSLRKQFVAASILLLVEEGRLALSDDVRRVIPELPDYGARITLDHMLTHTSGLRDWPGLLNLADGDVDAWTMILRQRGLNFPPGEEWSYSNTGYVLLTEIVKRASGMPFSDFARTRLFEPLGMKATAYVNDLQDVIKNRALAYERSGKTWRLDMLLGNDRGGGGALFTTASDLLIWNDALAKAKLGAFVSDKLQESATLRNGRTLTGAGRGLFADTYRGAKEIWYSGSAAAYKSWLGRYPEHALSVAILCNAGDGADRTAFAHRVFDLFVPNAPAPAMETGPPPAIAADSLPDVMNKAGLFFQERSGEPLRLSIDRGRFRVANGPGLVQITRDRFRRWGNTVQFMSQDAFELSFLSHDRIELKSRDGRTTHYRRAQAFKPTAADLEAFTGRYESTELKAVIHVTQGKDGLMGRINDTAGAGFEFRPIDRDTFQFGMLTLRFRRSTAGGVVGIDFSNPLLRSVSFERAARPAR